MGFIDGLGGERDKTSSSVYNHAHLWWGLTTDQYEKLQQMNMISVNVIMQKFCLLVSILLLFKLKFNLNELLRL